MSLALRDVRRGGLPPAIPWLADANEPDVLAGAARGTADLALWHRPAAPARERWLDTLPGDRLPTMRTEASPGAVRALVLEACTEAGHGATDPVVAALAADIADLAGRVCRLAGTAAADLRLDAIDHDACRRFHRDRVALRLVATYRGPGTQLVPPEHAAEALRLQGDYRGPLHDLDRRTVALFRGSADGGAGVVHRSPPVSGRGMTRLLLCLSVPFR